MLEIRAKATPPTPPKTLLPPNRNYNNATLTPLLAQVLPDTVRYNAVNWKPKIKKPYYLNRLNKISLICAIFALLSALLIPFAPVTQPNTAIVWPTQLTSTNRNANLMAPLVTHTPKEITLNIPCYLPDKLPNSNHTGVLFSTIPKLATDQWMNGMAIIASPDFVTITVRNNIVTRITKTKLTKCTNIFFQAQANTIKTEINGLTANEYDTFTPNPLTLPKFAGFFTDIPLNDILKAQHSGLKIVTKVDTRFINNPTLIKKILIILSFLSATITLLAIRLSYSNKNCRSKKTLKSINQSSFSFRCKLSKYCLDITVYGILIIWYLIAGGTADDGYILNLVRTAKTNGYLANYYRYFGAPETPFGWYFELLSQWAQFSPTGIWMRIPSLLLAALSWYLIKINIGLLFNSKNKLYNLATWSAAATFLVFWLPFNSGLRPESIIVCGSLLTWWLVEKYLINSNLTFLSLTFISAFLTTLTAPQGIIVLAILATASKAIIYKLKPKLFQKLLISLSPAIAICCSIVFHQQTLTSLIEAIRIRFAVGPVLTWAEEYIRYYVVFVRAIEGSLVNRLPVLLLLSSILIAIIFLLKKTHIPGIKTELAWRILGSIPIAMLLLTLTPTKWAIQFGVFAGITAVNTAILVPIFTALTSNSIRNSAIIISGYAIMLAITMSGYNSWYWVWSYSVSWYDRQPAIKNLKFISIFLYIALISALIALWEHVKPYSSNKDSDYKLNNILKTLNKLIPKPIKYLIKASPVLLVCSVLILCEVLVFTKVAVQRQNSYNIFKDNLNALKGNGCSMANEILVEANTNTSFLKPIGNYDVSTALRGDGSNEFSPNGFSEILRPYEEYVEHNQLHVVGSLRDGFIFRDSDSGTGGGIGKTIVNGSKVKLPFELSPQKTPFLGTYNANVPIELHSQWYTLPKRDAMKPLLIISAAGNIASYSKYGVFNYGQILQIEYGKLVGNTVKYLGYLIPKDPGPQIEWRNLRFPVKEIPPQADAVRILARDQILGNKQWLGFTPPRLPKLIPLQKLIGSKDPVLLDLSVAAQFPCQHPIDMQNGIWQIPKWRITPNRKTTFSVSKTWQDSKSGGILYTPDTLLHAETISTYLANDWYRNWGTIQKYFPYYPTTKAKLIKTNSIKSGIKFETPISN